MQNFIQALQGAIKTSWDCKALCDYRGGEYTFGDLAEKIEKASITFEKCGVKPGDHIALCARNTASWAVSFLSITNYTVVVPILADFHPDSINHLVDHSDSVLFFTDMDIFPKVDPEQMPQLKAIVNIADFKLLYCRDEATKAAFDNMDADFAAKHPAGYKSEDVKLTDYPLDTLAVINYTSGTTSAPKGVMLTYGNVSASVDFAQRHLPRKQGDTMVSMLPMAHIYGLLFEFLYPVCSNAAVYYLGKTPAPSLLLKAMHDVKPALVITVPLVMEKIYKSSLKPVVSKWYMKVLLNIPGVNSIIAGKIRSKIQGAFGGNVQEFIMGGAALNPEVEKCFRKIHLNYTVGYGMTEAAPLMAYCKWQDYAFGSCGKGIDCEQIRIDSEDPQHIVGEIQAKGANICKGYYKNEEATANLYTPDGFLHSGDLGIIDKYGNVFIKGRSKNMILSGNGQNIYPEEIEAVINAQNYVADSVVVSRAGKLVALVNLDQDAIKKASLDAEAVSDIPETLRVNANRVLPTYSQITKVEVMEAAFEKTPKGSIKRFMYK